MKESINLQIHPNPGIVFPTDVTQITLTDVTQNFDCQINIKSVYRQREVVVKIVFLQSFENQDERIHQSSNPPKSGYNICEKLYVARKPTITLLMNKSSNSSYTPDPASAMAQTSAQIKPHPIQCSHRFGRRFFIAN